MSKKPSEPVIAKTKRVDGFVAFDLLVHSCHMTQKEMAEYLDTTVDNIRNYSLGRRAVPQSMWKNLKQLFQFIESAAIDERKVRDKTIARAVARRKLERKHTKYMRRKDLLGTDAWMA